MPTVNQTDSNEKFNHSGLRKLYDHRHGDNTPRWCERPLMVPLSMQRTTFLKLRVSTDEVTHFNRRASALGVSVSQLIRDSALNGAVFVALEKSQAGYELRRVGAMLKHMYPAVDVRWTDDDRDRWWALINELRESADKLEALAISGKGAAAAMTHAG